MPDSPYDIAKARLGRLGVILDRNGADFIVGAAGGRMADRRGFDDLGEAVAFADGLVVQRPPEAPATGRKRTVIRPMTVKRWLKFKRKQHNARLWKARMKGANPPLPAPPAS
jgi:hypothetical protein